MGVEGESPILLPWQHNKSSCLHEASGFGTGSNESGASSDISSKFDILTLNMLNSNFYMWFYFNFFNVSKLKFKLKST